MQKIKIKIEHLDSWFAITGFTLPRNEAELIRFDKLHSDFNHQLTGDELDANKIWNGESQVEIKSDPKIVEITRPLMSMAARGLKNLSEDILNQMKANQENANK